MWARDFATLRPGPGVTLFCGCDAFAVAPVVFRDEATARRAHARWATAHLAPDHSLTLIAVR